MSYGGQGVSIRKSVLICVHLWLKSFAFFAIYAVKFSGFLRRFG
jgi:hypothetical protein